MERNLKSTVSTKRNYDAALIHRAIQGDQKAYAELMDRYRNTIFFMLYKMVKDKDDADDLTIEAFGKAFKNLSQYNSAFAFSTWLFNIATNNCIDFIRKKKLAISLDYAFQNEEGDQFILEPKSDSPNPEEKAINNQERQLMKTEVEKLDPHFRNLIDLRYFQEKSYQEIAEQLRLPIGTVKGQLFRARDLLYQSFKNLNKGN